MSTPTPSGGSYSSRLKVGAEAVLPRERPCKVRGRASGAMPSLPRTMQGGPHLFALASTPPCSPVKAAVSG